MAYTSAAGEDGLADADLPDQHLQVHHRLRGRPRPGLHGAETEDGRGAGERDGVAALALHPGTDNVQIKVEAADKN